VAVGCLPPGGGQLLRQGNQVGRLRTQLQRSPEAQLGDVAQLVDPARHARRIRLDRGQPLTDRRLVEATGAEPPSHHLRLYASGRQRILQVVRHVGEKFVLEPIARFPLGNVVP
jgi:hypothetical protein